MSNTEKLLKNNRFFHKPHLFLILYSLVLFSSCTSIQLKNLELSAINPSTSFYIDNFPYLTEQSNYKFISFLDAMSIKDIPQAYIYIDFTEDHKLRVSYQNQGGKLKSKTYNGEFKYDYYEVYFERKNIGIPPLFWETKIDRMRLAVNEKQNLVINHKYKHGKYYFFGLIFHNVTDDLLYDQVISKNRQQLFFQTRSNSELTSDEDFRHFL